MQFIKISWMIKHVKSGFVYPGYEIKQVLEKVEYLFIANTPKSTQTQGISTFWGPIYGPNRSVLYNV